MTTPAPRMGAVYDVGAALAMYWPDCHPCHETPEHPPWLILHPDGGIEWREELREGAKLDGYLPGFEPTQPQTIANTPPSPVSQAAAADPGLGGIAAAGPFSLTIGTPPPPPNIVEAMQYAFRAGLQHGRRRR